MPRSRLQAEMVNGALFLFRDALNSVDHQFDRLGALSQRWSDNLFWLVCELDHWPERRQSLFGPAQFPVRRAKFPAVVSGGFLGKYAIFHDVAWKVEVNEGLFSL